MTITRSFVVMHTHTHIHLQDKVTALHIAVHHKHAAVVQELVKKPEKEVLNARDHVSWCVPD